MSALAAAIVILLVSITTTFLLARSHGLRAAVVCIPVPADLVAAIPATVLAIATGLGAAFPRSVAPIVIVATGIACSSLAYYVAHVVVLHFQRVWKRRADGDRPRVLADAAHPAPSVPKPPTARPAGLPAGITSIGDFDHAIEVAAEVTAEIERRGKYDPVSFGEADHAAEQLRTLLAFANYCRHQAASMMRLPSSSSTPPAQGGLVS